MVVTTIEVIDKKKKKITFESGRTLFLYNSEVRKYHVSEGQAIDPSDYEDLIAAVNKRAKLKAMDLLKRSDKTEQELRTKLKTSNFSEEAVNVALDYVMSYGYIDDERYASNYIRTKKKSKSKRAIEFDLSAKGVDRETIANCMEEEFKYEDETEAIKKLIRKKVNNLDCLEEDKKQKLIASICRKGFSFEKVRTAFRELEENFDDEY
ncbi:MAG: regulatory protein RecX [bacterium]|nr:regulatory protein RecX [bacterium]